MAYSMGLLLAAPNFVHMLWRIQTMGNRPSHTPHPAGIQEQPWTISFGLWCRQIPGLLPHP